MTPSLMEQFGISRYSICFLPQDQAPGYFVWEDDDPIHKPGFTEIPVVGQVHWGVQMKNARIGDNVFSCKDSCGAILDSGTSLIAAPRSALLHLERALKHLDPDCSNMAEMPSLFFELGGVSIELPPEAYIARMVGVIPPSIWERLTFRPKQKVVMECVPLLMDLERNGVGSLTQYGPLWIVGMPFFRFYYTTFSFNTRQVHIARASASCDPLGTGDGIAAVGMIGGFGQKSLKAPMTIDPAYLRLPNPEMTEEGFLSR